MGGGGRGPGRIAHGSFTIGDGGDPGERGAVSLSSGGWERELHVLQESIRRMTGECDAFLYGSGPKPPIQTRRHIEEMIRRLNESEAMSAAERFRFSTLQGRFSALIERWERLQGEKEAGRRPGIYGHFREAAHVSGSAGPNAGPAASVQEERRALPADSDRDLFERYVSAKKARGEDVSGYRLEGFLEGLERERRKVRERLGAGEVVFDVAERDGRVRLIAKKKPRSAS